MTTVDLAALARQRMGTRDPLYYAPEIPPSKARAARHTHAVHLPEPEALLVLYDGTLFGLSDEGFVVTPERLCWRNFLDAPKQIEWRELDAAAVVVEDGELRVCGGRLFLLPSGPPARAVAAFLVDAARAVQASRAGPYRQGMSPDGPPPSGSITERQLLLLARRRLGDMAWLYFSPSIPERKLSRVRRVHAAHLPDDERIVLVYDSTLFGSAEEGLCMTRNRVCWKNVFDRPDQRAFADLDPTRIDTHGETLVIDGARVAVAQPAATRLATLLCDLAGRRAG
jgi:hypothetical protein